MRSEEHIAVVVIDLGKLRQGPHVVEGHRIEIEHLAQSDDFVVLEPLYVQPEPIGILHLVAQPPEVGCPKPGRAVRHR